MKAEPDVGISRLSDEDLEVIRGLQQKFLASRDEVDANTADVPSWASRM